MSSSQGLDSGDNDTGTEAETKLNSQLTKRAKRKKASRACFHCQKAHLTCDDSRPCERCVKRGLAETCQDGIRKKAKYLQDLDNEKVDALQSQKEETTGQKDSVEATKTAADFSQALQNLPDLSTSKGLMEFTASLGPASQTGYGIFGDNLLFDNPPLSTYDFDSKAANLEYSIISTMLGSALTPGTDHASPDQFVFPSPSVNGFQRSLPLRQSTTTPDHLSTKSNNSWSSYNGPPLSISQALPSTIAPDTVMSFSDVLDRNGQTEATPIKPSPVATSPMSSTAAILNQANTGRLTAVGGYTDPHGQRPTPVARRPFSASRDDSSSIYKAVSKPFSYTNGYHLLNTYLRHRFEREDLLRIARAIVGYRPSFIALTKTLREEDLTFMEVCFQRTLLEYEKFVGYSGTPTIIWRRTGQIELVGKEFCLLTQWSREQLLSKQTFIVELMDDSSVVEYFEKFSAHAFGDTSSVQTTCVLLTPQKRAVPCAFCFTVKRDVFDIPMMIVGNFLPVL